MRVLGIDPGYGIVGWGVVDFDDSGNFLEAVDYGVITTDKDTEFAQRILEIYRDICEILNTFEPKLVGIETLLFQNNAKTAMKVSEARGVIVLAVSQAGIDIKDISPLQVKMGITGYGKADKAQIQENIRLICGLDEVPKPDDAADAIAIAIAVSGGY